MTQIQPLEISKIKIDLELQPRSQMNWVTVAEYAEAMKEGVAFPSVVVFFDGVDYWLADGFHRIIAARDYTDLAEFCADVRQGSKRDATLYSVGANAEHGLQRKVEDKHNAVKKLLNDSEWVLWSDREIARQCKVGHQLVGSLRPKIHTGRATSMNGDRTFVHPKTGKPTTMNTTNIGKAAPAESEETLFDTAVEPAEVTALVDTRAQYEANLIIRPGESIRRGNIIWHGPPKPAQEETTNYAAEIVEESEPATNQPTSRINIINADSQYLSSLIDETVQLVITSPPYNVGIEYDSVSDDLSTYIPLITAVWKECYKVMQDGARIAVVVPFGIGRNPYIPFDCQIMNTLIDAGFELRGRIVWDKNTTGNRTSWGSWRLPSNPSIRDTTECIIVAHKGSSKLELPAGATQKDAVGSHTAWLADGEEFMALTQDHWVIAPESAQRVKHPAPFPIELAERLIKFYAYPGAHVLDPFGGSGTVAVAAQKLGCDATLVEISQNYCELAKGRLNK